MGFFDKLFKKTKQEELATSNDRIVKEEQIDKKVQEEVQDEVPKQVTYVQEQEVQMVEERVATVEVPIEKKEDQKQQEKKDRKETSQEIQKQEITQEFSDVMSTIGRIGEEATSPVNINLQAKVITGIELNKEPITYENFFELNEIERFTEFELFVNKLMRSPTLLNERDTMSIQVTLLYQKFTRIIPKLNEVKIEVTEFRKKDYILRTQILDYCKVINQINAKKLKGEEFEAVRAKLSPKLDELRKKRDEFIIEETAVNDKIRSVMHELNPMCEECLEIAKKII